MPTEGYTGADGANGHRLQTVSAHNLPLGHKLNPSQTDRAAVLQTAHVPPDHQGATLHPASLGPPRTHARLARGCPRLPCPSAGKSRTSWKIPLPWSPASPSRPTGPPFSPSGFRSETDCFFKSSGLDWLQASGSLWPKLKPGTIPEQVSSQCPVYLYSTND